MIRQLTNGNISVQKLNQSCKVYYSTNKCVFYSVKMCKIRNVPIKLIKWKTIGVVLPSMHPHDMLFLIPITFMNTDIIEHEVRYMLSIIPEQMNAENKRVIIQNHVQAIINRMFNV